MSLHSITHIEIPAPDLNKAISFYSKIFKWKTEVVQEDIYAFFTISSDASGAGTSGGGFVATLRPAEENTGPQIVIDVEDIGKTLQEIEQEGGEIVLPKTEIEGGHGFYASFRDPNGNLMQIHSRK